MALRWSLVLLAVFCCVNGTPSAAAGTRPVAQRSRNIWTDEAQTQFATLREFITQLQKDARIRKRWEVIATQTFEPESLILTSDRDQVDVVLRRTGALLAYLRSMPGAPDFSAEEARLARLKADAAGIAVEDKDSNVRYQLFEQVLRLRRKIAFSNPLLDFDRILFIKRHFLPETATWGSDMLGNHMCDQFYGFHAIPGGGLFVLENSFGESRPS